MSLTEWIAVIATILSVIMLTKAKSSGWIFGIIGNVLYWNIFFDQTLYADMVIQLIFVIQGFYGLFEWNKTKDINKPFTVEKIDSMSLFLIVFSTLGISVFISLAMFLFTDNKSPILDTVLSICSIIALYMMTKKIIQSWFIWMMIDIGYIYLFLSIGLWLSAFLFLFLFVLCISGYMQWKKKLIKT